MLNHAVIMGRMVADPVLKTTPSGVSVCTIRLACDRDFKNKQTGEKETDFVSVVCWRSTAEFVSKYFSKGRMAVADGRIQVRDYEDRDGTKHTITELVAENVYFADQSRNGAGEGQFTELPRDNSSLPY